jgi:hypothetical protein
MAVLHQTTLVPTKLELLTAWLPQQDWYAGEAAGPSLAKAGGFRLDDPAGEVGIEFMVVRDDAGRPAAAYLVPLTYRGRPLAGGDAALIGMAEHGVLGTRWIYDGSRDPVLLEQLSELIQGRVGAQAQSQSNTPDATVHAAPAAAAPGQRLGIWIARRLSPVADGTAPPGAGEVTGSWTATDGILVRSRLAAARPAHSE